MKTIRIDVDQDRNQRYVECWDCGKPLYIANQDCDGDYAYHIDNVWICEDCISTYMFENYLEEVGA